MLEVGFGSVTGIILFAVLIATINERLVEQFVKPILNRYFADGYQVHVALLTGFLISLAFGVDFVSPLAESVMGVPLLWDWAGIVLSGLIVGGGSNFVHDIGDMIRAQSN